MSEVEQIRQPVERSTLASLVASKIRSGVLRGSYEPGSQLNEVELAERYGVSRGPVREALQRLVQEGLLNREPHRGVFVPVIRDEDIVDIYRAREVIETAAIRILMGAEDSGAVRNRVWGIVGDMERAATAESWAEVAELDLRFHTTLVEGAGSPRLSRMYGMLIDETRLCLGLSVSNPGRKDLVDEHRALAAMLEKDDIPAAMAASSHHFNDAVRSLIQRRISNHTSSA
jgi:DNA-binding GntR family transcriptional regulator